MRSPATVADNPVTPYTGTAEPMPAACTGFLSLGSPIDVAGGDIAVEGANQARLVGVDPLAVDVDGANSRRIGRLFRE